MFYNYYADVSGKSLIPEIIGNTAFYDEFMQAVSQITAKK
jgi:hypothetical protein